MADWYDDYEDEEEDEGEEEEEEQIEEPEIPELLPEPEPESKASARAEDDAGSGADNITEEEGGAGEAAPEFRPPNSTKEESTPEERDETYVGRENDSMRYYAMNHSDFQVVKNGKNNKLAPANHQTLTTPNGEQSFAEYQQELNGGTKQDKLNKLNSVFDTGNQQIRINYAGFDTVYDAAAFLGTLEDDKTRMKVAKEYCKYAKIDLETFVGYAESLYHDKLFFEPQSTRAVNAANNQKITAQFAGLSMLGTDGQELSYTTAGFNQIVNAIRREPDKAKRNQMASLLEASTKQEGSRFYGYSFDKTTATQYLDNSNMTLDDYNAFKEGFIENQFSGMEGDEVKDYQAYSAALAELESTDQDGNPIYSDYQKFYMKNALDSAFYEHTGIPYGDFEKVLNIFQAQQEEQVIDAEKAGKLAEETEKEKGGIGSSFSSFLKNFGWGYDVFLRRSTSGQEQPEGEGEEKEKSLLQQALDEDKVKKKSGSGKSGRSGGGGGGGGGSSKETLKADFPEIQSVTYSAATGRSSPEYKIPGQDQSANVLQTSNIVSPNMDPAYDEYTRQHPFTDIDYTDVKVGSGDVHIGNTPDDLINAYWDYFYSGNADQLDEESQEAVKNFILRGNPARSALFGAFDSGASEDGNSTRYTVPGTAEGRKILGTYLGYFAKVITNPDYNPEMRRELLRASIGVIDEVDRMVQNGELDPGNYNPYDFYIRKHPEVNAQFLSSINTIKDSKGAIKRASEAAQIANVEDAEQRFKDAVTAYESGSYSDEDWEIISKRIREQEQSGPSHLDQPDYYEMAAMIDSERGNVYSGSPRPDNWFMKMWRNEAGEDAILNPNSMPSTYEAYAYDVLNSDYYLSRALGYTSLDDFYAARGIEKGDLFSRAEDLYNYDNKRAADEEAAKAMQALAYSGTGDVNIFEYGQYAMTKGIESWRANLMKAGFQFSQRTDDPKAAEKIRKDLYANYGLYGQTVYKRFMLQAAEEGKFLSDENNQFVKDYLERGGDPFLLGIDPKDFGWTLRREAEIGFYNISAMQYAQQKTLTPTQGEISNVIENTAANVVPQTISRMIGILGSSVGVGPLASAIGMLFAYGPSTYGEYFDKSLGEGYMPKDASLHGFLASVGTVAANMGTDFNFVTSLSQSMGISDLVAKSLANYGAHPLFNTALAFSKAFVENQVEEGLQDEFLEPIFGDFLVGLAKTKSLAGAFENVDVPGTIMSVLDNAPAVWKSNLIMAAIFGGSEASNSLRGFNMTKAAAERVCATGSPEAAADFVRTAKGELSVPENAEAFDKFLYDNQIQKETNDNIIFDSELDDDRAKYIELRDQADAHQAEIDKAKQAQEEASGIIESEQAKLDAGEGDDTTVQNIADAAEASSKAQQSIDEHTRELNENRTKSADLFRSMYVRARDKAVTTVQHARAYVNQLITETADRARSKQTETNDALLSAYDAYDYALESGDAESIKQAEGLVAGVEGESSKADRFAGMWDGQQETQTEAPRQVDYSTLTENDIRNMTDEELRAARTELSKLVGTPDGDYSVIQKLHSINDALKTNTQIRSGKVAQNQKNTATRRQLSEGFRNLGRTYVTPAQKQMLVDAANQSGMFDEGATLQSINDKLGTQFTESETYHEDGADTIEDEAVETLAEDIQKYAEASAPVEKTVEDADASAERIAEASDNDDYDTLEAELDADTAAETEANSEESEQSESTMNEAEPEQQVEQTEQTEQAAETPATESQSADKGYTNSPVRKSLQQMLMRNYGIKLIFADADPRSNAAEGFYRRSTKELFLNPNLGDGEVMRRVALHELTHFLEGRNGYNTIRDSILDAVYGTHDFNAAAIQAAMQDIAGTYEKQGVNDLNLQNELVARAIQEYMSGDEQFFNDLIEQGHKGLVARMYGAVKSFLARRSAKKAGVDMAVYDSLRSAEKAMRNALRNARNTEGDAALRTAMENSAHPESEQFSVSQLARANGLKLEEAKDGNYFTIEWKDADGNLRSVNSPYRLIDDKGNTVTEITAGHIATTPIGKLITIAEGFKSIDHDTAVKQMQMFADLTTMAARYGGDKEMVWEIAGADLFSSLKNNSDPQYSTTIDFGTICAKTQAIVDVMSQEMLRKGRGLTREEVLDIYAATAHNGMSVPCPVCYVFSRWMGVPSLLDRMSRYQDRFAGMAQKEVQDYIRNTQLRYDVDPKEAAKKLNADKSKIEKKINSLTEAFGKTTGKAAREDIVRQIDELEEQYNDIDAYNWVTQVLCKETRKDSNEYVLDPKYKAVPKEILFDFNRTGEFASNYNKSWRYRNTRGAGMGKSIMPYTGSQIGDVVKSRGKYTYIDENGEEQVITGQSRWTESQNPFFMNKDKGKAKNAVASAIKRTMAQNLIGGQRFQSTSDYRPEWGLDYMMTFLEMQAVGAKAQLYTKVIEAVDMFASAGAEVNLSLMGKGQGWHYDSDGKVVLDFSNITGIDADLAREKIKKYPNVQGILVGLNDEHIRAAMASDWINFIIPWHSSGNKKDTLQQMLESVGEQLDPSKATDYTNEQNDTEIKAPKPPKKPVEPGKRSSAETRAQYQNDLAAYNEAQRQYEIDLAAWQADEASGKHKRQEALRDIRKKILTGKLRSGGNIITTQEELDLINSNPYIKELYRKFYLDTSDPDFHRQIGNSLYHVKLSASQAEHIFPYEYWDTTSTLKNADVNGQRFVEYCDALGLKPRFSSFKNDPGYWKLLIDRSMYNNDGSYHVQQPLDVTKVKVDDIATQAGTAKYGDQAKYDSALAEAERMWNDRQQAKIDDAKALVGSDAPDTQFSIDTSNDNPSIDNLSAMSNDELFALDRNNIIDIGIENARSKYNSHNSDTDIYVNVKSDNSDIRITRRSLNHGVYNRRRRNRFNILATAQIGDILENSYKAFELEPREANNKSYIYLGKLSDNTEEGTEYHPVICVVNEQINGTQSLDSLDVLDNGKYLYSINAKKESLLVQHGIETQNDSSVEPSIQDIYGLVNDTVYKGFNVKQDFLGKSPKKNMETMQPGEKRSFPDDDIEYSLREKDPPTKTIIAYKAFYARNGKLYPPMVANQTDEVGKGSGTFKGNDTPVGVWLDADVGGILLDENGEPVRNTNGRLKVQNAKSGGKEGLAFRPGWHLGEWPDAKQFNKSDPDTKERGARMPDNLVFAECEIAADNDYQIDAMEYGVSKKGKYNRTQAGYPQVPVDGYYKYRTNPDPDTAPWYITGAMRVTRILDDDMAAEICARYGVTPDQRYSGKKINLADYGLTAGPVEPTQDVDRYRENDVNRANKALLERALADPRYSNAYVRRSLNWDDPEVQKEFERNGQDINKYRPAPDTQFGLRQFGNKTAQASDVIMDKVKDMLKGSEYEETTNSTQIFRAAMKFQELGYDGTMDYLLGIQPGHFTPDDNALMYVAIEEAQSRGDITGQYNLAARFDEEGTEQGRALQNRKLFLPDKMGATVQLAETRKKANDQNTVRGMKRDEVPVGHEPPKEITTDTSTHSKEVYKEAEKTFADLMDNTTGEISTNNPWGLDLNDFQTGLIRKYKLEHEKLPGIHYNKATLKQRMLAAILATPNDWRGDQLLTLTQQLEFMAAGDAVTTEADLNYIVSQANEALTAGLDNESGEPITREAKVAMGRLFDAQKNITKVGAMDKFNTFRYSNMLSGTSTWSRNIMSNVMVAPLENMSTRIAEWVDKAVATKTDNRTTARADKAARQTGRDAFVEEIKNTVNDYFVDRTDTSHGRKYDVGQGTGRIYQNELLETYQNVVGFAMQIGDRPFYEHCYEEERATLEKLGTKIYDEDAEQWREMNETEIHEEATLRALERVFQEDNAIVSWVASAPEPISFVLKTIMPFTCTPTNIARRMLQYSPFGLTWSLVKKGLIDSKINGGTGFDQRKFVMGVGRGLTGTGLIAAGMLLASSGIIRPGREDEEDKRKRDLLGVLGEAYGWHIDLFGQQREIDWALPSATGILLGAAMANRIGDSKSAANVAIGLLADMGNTLFDNTFLSTLNDLFRGYEDGAGWATRFLETSTESLASQVLSPSFIRQIAKATDPYVRDTASQSLVWGTLKANVIQNWPVLRQMLPIRVDISGDSMLQSQYWQGGKETSNLMMNFLDYFISPTATIGTKNDQCVYELLDLAYRADDGGFLPQALLKTSAYSLTVTKTMSKNLKLGGEQIKVKLTDDEKRELNESYANLLFNGDGGRRYRTDKNVATGVTGIRAMMDSPKWARMTDDQRIEAIKDMESTVKNLILADFIRRKRDEGDLL